MDCKRQGLLRLKLQGYYLTVFRIYTCQNVDRLALAFGFTELHSKKMILHAFLSTNSTKNKAHAAGKTEIQKQKKRENKRVRRKS